MRTERIDAKIAPIGYLIVIGFLIILVRLWQLQILQGDEFRKISETNRLRVIGVPAPRGIIFDRNGIPLVKNTPLFCASIVPGEFDESNAAPLAKLLNVPPDELSRKIERSGQSPSIPVKIK
jgi:penicillin-binding protein 2